jgi:tetratricopeptide (TPR) repeat protein
MDTSQLSLITQIIQRLHSAQCLFFQQNNTKAAAHQFSESFQELSTLPPQTQEDLKLTEYLKLFAEGFLAWCEAASIYHESYFYIEASEAYQRAASKFESFLSLSQALGLNSMEIYANGLARYCFALSQRSLEGLNRISANFEIASCYASEAATSCAKAGEFFNTLAGQKSKDKISQQLISDDLGFLLYDEMCVMHEFELADHYYMIGLTFERKGKSDEAINNYSRSKEYVEKCLNRVREKFGAFTYWGDIESLTSRLHDYLVL